MALELFDLVTVTALKEAATGCCVTRALDAPQLGSAERVLEVTEFSVLLLPRLTWQIQAFSLS